MVLGITPSTKFVYSLKAPFNGAFFRLNLRRKC